MGQHVSPVCPQVVQDPVTHVGPRVSQQAPVHVLPAQQGWPTAPQAEHVPLTHESPLEQALPVEQQACPDPPHAQLPALHMFPLLHVPPDAMQPLVSQHPPALHMLPAQHANPEEPHAWHTPPAQTLPEAIHAAPPFTHLLVPGSQHPAPLHIAPEQQA